jgi:hypothetical protein
MHLKSHIILASLLSLINVCTLSAAFGPEHESFIADPSASVSFAQSHVPSAPSEWPQHFDPGFLLDALSSSGSASSASPIVPTFELPKRRFDFEQAFQGLGSSVTLSLAVGAAAAGVYVLSSPPETRKKLTALGYASGAALVSAGLSALFGYDILRKISKTRYALNNAGTTPQYLRKEMDVIIGPKIAKRVKTADEAISAEHSRHDQVVARSNYKIASIRSDLAASKTLPDQIAQLRLELSTAQNTHAQAERTLQDLSTADLAITTADRETATRDFNSDLRAAQISFDTTMALARTQVQAPHSFASTSSNTAHTPKKIKPRKFFSATLQTQIPDHLQHPDTSYHTLHSYFEQKKEEIIDYYALPIARERRENELRIAAEQERTARTAYATVEARLNAKSARLATIEENRYYDEDVCAAAVKDEEAKIKSENNDHESRIKGLGKEKDIAETETDDDREFAKAALLESCSSENNSWYTGWTASSTVSALAAAAGLWYYIAHK